MRRLAAVFAVLLITAACGDDDATTTGAETTSTSTVPPTILPTTTVDTTAEEITPATDRLLGLIDDNGSPVELLNVGTLDEDGRFVDDFGRDVVPEIDLDVTMVVGLDGLVWFLISGDEAALATTSWEFDFYSEDGLTVVSETSIVAAGAPAWVEEAAAGSVIRIAPESSMSGFLQTGSALSYAAYLLYGFDTAKSEYFQARDPAISNLNGTSLSAWAYRPVGGVSRSTSADARWVYAHYTLTLEQAPAPYGIAAEASSYSALVENTGARTKVAEPLSAVPQDRVLFLYRHFGN